jgi:hypothetical protein
MGIWWDALRVVVTLQGPPARVLDVVRAGADADACFWRAFPAEGVRWPAEWGERPWSAVHPDGEALLAASEAALPAKLAELGRAIAAYEIRESQGDLPADYTPDRDTECMESLFYSTCLNTHDNAEGTALAELFRRDHALLLAWGACSHTKHSFCMLGHGQCDVGFEIEHYQLGGDTLRFSFPRFGVSFGLEHEYWRAYRALSRSLPADLRQRIVVQAHGGHDHFSFASITSGAPARKLLWHVPWSCTDPDWEVNGEWGLHDELFGAVRNPDSDDNEEGHAPRVELDDDDAFDAQQRQYGNVYYDNARNERFDFFRFCAQGSGYKPEGRALIRDFSEEGHTLLCARRTAYDHAARVIQRAFRAATANPYVFRWCKRRLGRLFSAYAVPEFTAAQLACAGEPLPGDSAAFGPLLQGALTRADAQPEPGALLHAAARCACMRLR